MKRLQRLLTMLAGLAVGCATTRGPVRYDAVIRNGLIYDGSGSGPRKGDVAIAGDRIAAVGDIGSGRGSIEIDAHGRAVAPGFINMLSPAGSLRMSRPLSGPQPFAHAQRRQPSA